MSSQPQPCFSTVPAVGTQDRQIPRACSSVSMVVGSLKDLVLELRWRMIEKDPALASGSCACMWIYMCTHLYACEYTCADRINTQIKLKSLCPDITGFKARHQAPRLALPWWEMGVFDTPLYVTLSSYRWLPSSHILATAKAWWAVTCSLTVVR